MACEDESVECKKAIDDYNKAHQDFLNAQSDINRHRGNRNVGGAAAGAGLAFTGAILVLSGPIGWLIVGGAIVGAGAGWGGAAMNELRKARDRCKAAIGGMYDAYNRASEHCKDKSCIPPRPSEECN